MKRALVCAAMVGVIVLSLGSPGRAGGGGWGGPGSFAPGWARTMSVSVRDNSGKPVHFVAFFRAEDEHHEYRACGGRRLTATVPYGGLDFFVEVRAGVVPKCSNPVSNPTSGSISVTYAGSGRSSIERLSYDGPGGFTLP